MRTRDHPRSRGVYMSLKNPLPGSEGSSPLARGLPRAARAGRALPGIIPARAGFTEPGIDCGAEVGDHPRSRGVYLPMTVAQMAKTGSSPLARGLPVHDLQPQRDLGIIPARAGFTQIADSQSHSPGGSSPLARGLQPALGARDHCGGIIPARAGFTRSSCYRRRS